ncbi:MAG: ribbon-helix-helix domain-containing protein [Thalassotalea sp.]|nr:ribbon-helix-helix domain-containing protein [Thalassotalea sp.]
MSLADLKKQNYNDVKRNFTVDEFIDDATNYAAGRPEIVSADLKAQTKKLTETIAKSVQHVEHDNDKPFKHATFTLSTEVIQQLNELSEKTSIPKSRLLRILVNDFYYEENPSTLQQSKIK